MALIIGFLQTIANSYSLYLYATSKSNFDTREFLICDVMFWHIVILIEMFFIAIVSGTICEEVPLESI